MAGPIAGVAGRNGCARRGGGRRGGARGGRRIHHRARQCVEDPHPAGAGAAPARAVPARLEHLESLVDCHLRALPGDFLPRLGRDLVRAHDRFYIEQPDGVCLVTLDAATGRVTGFILGGSPAVRSRFVRRFWAPLLARVLGRSLTDSFVRHHALELAADAARRALPGPGRGRNAADGIPAEPPGTWGVSIALGTHPEFRSDGAGKAVALLEGMHAGCAALGFSVTRAMTATDNATSHLLHTRLGWKLIGTRGGYHYYRREVEGRTAPERGDAGR
jgi:hypothetical protein